MQKLACVIVETRRLPNLVEIIQEKHMRFLPEGTQLIIFHSKENESELKAAFPNSGFSLLEGVNSLQHYNEILTNPKFWEMLVDFERVLIFQADSEILRTGLEEFWGWDYCGARWAWNPNHPGNGGLSLRNPKTMLEILSRVSWNGSQNEDHYFTKAMYDHKIGNLCPIEVAERFSVEAVFNISSWGIHAIDKWLSPSQCEEIRLQYQK